MSSSQVNVHRGPQCDYCRSTWFYTENGLEFCRRCDTQQQDRIQVEVDEDSHGKGGKITKVKKVKAKRLLIEYQGRHAFELYLQCYQLILWKQCHTLIHKKGFPARVETVVKDLWALKLQRLQDKIGSLDHVQDGAQTFSSQGETTDAEESGKDGMKRLKAFPKLIDTLALCYLAAVLLRLPISVGDLHRWVVTEEITFFRAIRSIPEIMRSKLPAEYVGALDLKLPLGADDIQDAIRSQLKFYGHGFGLNFPQLNYKPLLLRYIETLGLPLELFLPATHLSTLLSRTFDFPYQFQRKRLTPLPETELLSLLVIIVKLFNPFDNLERQVTSVSDLGFLTINWNHWTTSQKSYQEMRDSHPHVSRSKNVDVQETDIFSLSGSQLDDYLDWYEDTWVEESRVYTLRKRYDVSEQLEALFPIGRPEKAPPSRVDKDQSEQAIQDALLQKLTSNQAHLNFRKIVPNAKPLGDEDEKLRRIGSFYKRYKRVEDIPANAKSFYEAAADYACLSLDSLVKAVYSLEVALIGKRRRDKKNGVVSDEEEEGSEDETEDGPENELEDDVEAEQEQGEVEDPEDGALSDKEDGDDEDDENE